MEKKYSTARFVFSLLSISGFVILIIAPLWAIIFGAAGSIFGFGSTLGGVLVALGQALLGLSLIAGAQLGLAQVEVANNTAAILTLLKHQDRPSSSDLAPRAQTRKEPTLEKPIKREN